MMDGDISQLGLLDDEDILLDEAALLLAAADHPGVDVAPYSALIEEMAARLRAVGGAEVAGLNRARLLSRVLADEFGFVGDRETYDDPDNADLIRVMDRKQGLPVSLSILYVAIARRLGWTADALDVPGHVLTLIGDDSRPVVIDPFRGGMVVEADDLARLVASTSGDDAPAVRHVAAMTNRGILSRLLLNQATRAEKAGKGRRALTLYERITTFAPDNGYAWWHRARLELIDGDVDAGRRSLTAMLEVTRDPVERARITELLHRL